MGNSLWRRWRQRLSNSSSAREGRCPAKRLFARLWLELLEDRSLPSASIPPTIFAAPIHLVSTPAPTAVPPITVLPPLQGVGGSQPSSTAPTPLPPITIPAPVHVVSAPEPSFPSYTRGPSSYVEIFNQTISIYGLDHKARTTMSLADFWLKAGHLGSTDGGSGLNSPFTFYFDAIGRFMVSEVDVNPNTHAITMNQAQSLNSSPTLSGADWTFLQSTFYDGKVSFGDAPAPEPPVNVKFVNQRIGIYGLDSARPTTTSSLADFWFKEGHLGSTDGGSGLKNPTAQWLGPNDGSIVSVSLGTKSGHGFQVYRGPNDGFFVSEQDVNPGTGAITMDFAHSKSNNPATLTAADWIFSQVTSHNGTWIPGAGIEPGSSPVGGAKGSGEKPGQNTIPLGQHLDAGQSVLVQAAGSHSAAPDRAPTAASVVSIANPAIDAAVQNRLGSKDLTSHLTARKRSNSPSDWLTDAWLAQ
jgi:hypothetical protein